MDIGVLHTGILAQSNIWLHFISYYRKINRSSKTSLYLSKTNKNKTKYKGFCLKRWISNQRLLGELTTGRAAMSF